MRPSLLEQAKLLLSINESGVNHDIARDYIEKCRQLDERDKTIAELRDEVKTVTACCELNQAYVHDLAESNRKYLDYAIDNEQLKQQNTIMREALERMTTMLGYAPDVGLYNAPQLRGIAREALAKVQIDKEES